VALQRFRAHPGVLGEGSHRRVTGVGHEHRRAGAVLSVVGERRVAELQGSATGRGLEDGFRLLVVEPGVAVLV